ncbi:hypothetical protein B0J14DRAFT_255104 [Halenospora varia]|nr:hypothetical protein B0J14DRAFT_255104 [Halenospora varia]
MNLLICSTLIFLSYVGPSEGGNIIFSSPVAGMTVVVGSPFAIQWTITVDSGDLTLESAPNGGTQPRVIATGLNGKSFTWTPSEADSAGLGTSGKALLRLTDKADSVREGASDTFVLSLPQQGSGSSSMSTLLPPTQSQSAPSPGISSSTAVSSISTSI